MNCSILVLNYKENILLYTNYKVLKNIPKMSKKRLVFWKSFTQKVGGRRVSR